MVPLVLAVLVAALQVMILSLHRARRIQAARDGARAYSLGPVAGRGRPGQPAGSDQPGERLDLSGPTTASRVTVQAPPMLFLLDRQVTRTVTMP